MDRNIILNFTGQYVELYMVYSSAVQTGRAMFSQSSNVRKLFFVSLHPPKSTFTQTFTSLFQWYLSSLAWHSAPGRVWGWLQSTKKIKKLYLNYKNKFKNTLHVDI